MAFERWLNATPLREGGVAVKVACSTLCFGRLPLHRALKTMEEIGHFVRQAWDIDAIGMVHRLGHMVRACRGSEDRAPCDCVGDVRGI